MSEDIENIVSGIEDESTETSNENEIPESQAPQARKKRTAKPKSTSAVMSNDGKGNSPLSATKCAYMYLGPSLPGGLLLNGSVYKELPEHLRDIFEKAPDIKGLFIEVREAPAFKAKMKIQGSEAFRMRQNAEKSISDLLREGAFKRGRI